MYYRLVQLLHSIIQVFWFLVLNKSFSCFSNDSYRTLGTTAFKMCSMLSVSKLRSSVGAVMVLYGRSIKAQKVNTSLKTGIFLESISRLQRIQIYHRTQYRGRLYERTFYALFTTSSWKVINTISYCLIFPPK